MSLDPLPRSNTQKRFLTILFALSALSLLLSGYALYSERERIASGYGDYVIYYSGAEIVRDGGSKQLYDLRQQWRYQAKFATPIRAGALPFNHPAYELLWHLPLTYLSYPYAYIVWNLINVGLLVGLARTFVPPVAADLRRLSLIMALGFYPVLVTWLHGQDSILLSFAIGASMVALKQRRWIAAGLWLALASFKPQIAVPIALAWAFGGFGIALAAWLIGASALACVSLWMVGIDGAAQYVAMLTWMDGHHYAIDPIAMPNLRGLIFALLYDRLPALVVPLTVALSTGALVWMAHLWRRLSMDREQDFDWTVALTLTLACLTSYHAYLHDFSLMIVPAAIVSRDLISGAADGIAATLLGVLLVILWLPFPITFGKLQMSGQIALGALLVIAFAALIAIRLNSIRGSAEPPIQPALSR